MPRILYIPMYSSPTNLATDSTYNWAKIFFHTIVEYDPKAFVYFAVPQGVGHSFHEIDHPRIYKFPVPMFGNDSQYLEAALLQQEYVNLFGELRGKYMVDIVACDKATVIPAMRMGSEFWINTGGAPRAYVSKAPFIFDSDAISSLYPHLDIMQSLGYAQSDVVLWMSEGDFERGMGIASKYLSPALLDRAYRSKHLGGFLANFALTKSFELDPMAKPRSPKTISWGYGLNSEYHCKEVLEEYAKISRADSDVRVLITTSSRRPNPAVSRLVGSGEFEVYFALPQAEYFRKLREAHVFVYHVTRPATAPSSVMEQQIMGLVGVFPRSDKVPSCLFDGYPYLFRTKKEMNHLVRYLLDNYFENEVQEVIKKQKEYLLSKFDPVEDSKIIYDRLTSILSAREEEILSGRNEAFVDLLRDCALGFPELTMEQLLVLIHKNSRDSLDLKQVRQANRVGICAARVRLLMRAIGYEDTCEGPEVVFRRIS